MDETQTTWDADRLARRRAVEALRSGVPNADAVAALGSGQSEIEDRFARLLSAVERPGRPHDRASVLVSGGFGEGKSHLLAHLGHLATLEGFVVSPVVVSKETPLHDPAKVFRAAVESAVAPGGVRDVVSEAAAALDPDSPQYAQLLRWLRGRGSDLNERFDATLYLHGLLGSAAPGADEEFLDAIVRFWSGYPLPMPELRRQLKAVGAGKRYTFTPIKARELARQRLRFLPQLLRAAGHTGWVVLFDEVELIGQYSVLQRGRSYAELARWLDGDGDDDEEPLVTVVAMTDDFDAAVLSGKNDRTVMPDKLRNKQTPEYDELATLAQAGMRHIERDAVALVPPTPRSSTGPIGRSGDCTARHTSGSRPTSRGSSASVPPGCASTCAPGSTSGTLSDSTRPTARRPRCSTWPVTTASRTGWTSPTTNDVALVTGARMRWSPCRTTRAVYCGCMPRTNIDLDDRACRAVMERYHFTTKRAAVNFALRTIAAEPLPLDDARRLRGSGWAGDLAEMRTGRIG